MRSVMRKTRVSVPINHLSRRAGPGDTGDHRTQEVPLMTDAMACPVSHSFDPLGDAYVADPYPILSGVREETPAFYAPAIDMWVITRLDDIQGALMDPKTFSAAVGQRPVFPLAEETRSVLEAGFHAYPVMSD